jgi:tetratricopeptide (TPR) repeat protein
MATTAVTYISQRFASLAALFFLLSLVCYARARLSKPSARRKVLYALALLSAALAMKTKENAFTLPLVVALFELFFLKASARERFIFLSPLLATMLIIPLTILGRGEPGIGGEDVPGMTLSFAADISRSEYLITQFRVIVTYVRLLVLPVNQNLDYAYPAYQSVSEPAVLASLLFLLAMFFLAVYAAFRSFKSGDMLLRLLSFGVLWFFITLSVESSIIPLSDVIFEYRAYLPSAGLFMAVGSAFFMGLSRLGQPRIRMSSAFLLVSIAVVLGALTVSRNSLWRNEVDIWRDTAIKSPGKPRAYNNLGTAYRRAGNLKRAVEAWEQALNINWRYPPPLRNLGNVHAMYGDHETAYGYYKRYFQLEPGDYETHYNMALVSEELGYRADSLKHLELFVQEAPPQLEGLVSQAKEKIDELRGGSR